MRRGWRWCVSAVLATALTRSVYAEPTEPTAKIWLDSRIGQSTAPYFTAVFPRASGYGASIVVGGSVPLTSRFYVGARIPLVLMRVQQPAGALYAEAAWANPELSAALQQPWFDYRSWRSHIVASFALGAPLAEHDAAQLAGRALRLANALEGFSEPALYTPGVIPFTPSGTFTLQNPRWKLSAALGVPLLVRVSDADLPSGAHPRQFGVIPVASVEVQCRVLRWLSLAVSPRLSAAAIAPVEDHAPPVQVLAAAHADFRFAESLSVSALFQVPVGPPLGGSTAAGGLRFGTAF